MFFLEAVIYIKSNKSLEDVGAILSNKLFGGLSFGGKENSIRDEIPTIYIDSGIMGLSVLIMGGDKDCVSVLEVRAYDHPTDLHIEKTEAISPKNFEDYLKFLLRDIEDLNIMSDTEIEEFEAKFDS